LIVVVPVPDDVASPKFVTTATPALLEVQVAKVVNTCVLLSLKVPVAMNCRLCPVLIVALAGVTASEVSVALVTFTEIVPAGTDPKTALMVAVPGATPRTTPPLAETVATAASFDVQTAESVRSCVVPSAKFPVAFNWTEVSAASFDDALGEVTVSDTNAADVTASEVVPLMLPCLAVMVVDPAPCPVARPLLLIVATFVSELVHVTAVLMFCVDPSL